MSDSELKPDRIVFVHTCAICGREISRSDPKAWISGTYKDSRSFTTPVHAHCVRRFLFDPARTLLDPEKVASDADLSGA